MSGRRSSFSLASLLPSSGNKNEKKQRKSLAAFLFPSSNFKARSASVRRSVAIQENYECIVLIWFEQQQFPSLNTINSFRSISDSVRIYADWYPCFEAMRISKEKIFFISSSIEKERIDAVQDIPAVEGIFLLDSNTKNLGNNWPKLCGTFDERGELFRELRETLDIFEQIQLEYFAFEGQRTFLWRQFWKRDLINRKVSTNKQAFIDVARNYYQNNSTVNGIIDDLEKSYRSADVLNWCLRSPFPARFLRHAVAFENKEQLDLCRFLFVDTIRVFQKQPVRKFCTQVYRGMKLSKEQLDRFEEYAGRLLCTSGFFPCTKSRTNAMALALSPNYRPDLSPVLFKIDCESNDLFIEISNTVSPSSTIVFDVCMTFRVVCIKRDQLIVITLKTAGDDGQQLTQNYLSLYPQMSVESILDSQFSLSIETVSDESKAQKHLEEGNIDLALIAYKRIQPVSARILNIIGRLSTERKWDYDYAFQCHCQALQMQEQDGHDVSETLTHLGNVYYHRRELDLALSHYQQALNLQETANPKDSAALGTSLAGLSHTYCARQEYPQAIASGEQALALREAIVPLNETELVKILMILGNIYHDCGQNTQALDRSIRALMIVEHTEPVDRYALAELLNHLGNIVRDLNDVDKALLYLERAVEIYKQILPRGHPTRVSAEIDFEQANLSKEKSEQNVETRL